MGLTDAQLALVNETLDYLRGNYEKPIDDRAAWLLSKVAVDFGFSQQEFMDGMKDAPVSTLLQVMLNANAALT